MICPDCKGEKRVFAHVNRGDGGSSGFEWINCLRCKGAGEVPDEQAVWMLEGVKLRTERMARGLSLREEAKRLGISPVELSAIERGMRAPTVNPEHP